MLSFWPCFIITDRGYSLLVCYPDSLHAMSLVLAPIISFHRYATIVHNIKDLLSRYWTIHIVHTLTEENASADFLAKLQATFSSSWTCLDLSPPGLSRYLHIDASRVSIQRFQFLVFSPLLFSSFLYQKIYNT